jgi:plastocyanin
MLSRLPIIRPPTRIWWPRLGVAAVLLGAALAASAVGATANVNMSAGAESAGGDVQVNTFAPRTLTVAAGDSVTWRIDSAEFHTIHFLGGNPAPDFIDAGPDGVFLNAAATMPSGGSSYDGSGIAGSGLLTQGQTYSLSFPKPGTYDYVCLVHPNMKGSVVVKAAGEATDSQAVVDARRTAEVNADLARHGIGVLVSNMGELPAEGVSAGISAGAGDEAVMVARFLPGRVTVKTGDAVTWVWKDPLTPHTVTFLGGAPLPEVVIPRAEGSGPPRLELNPGVLAPAGEPTSYDGSGWLNSGFLDPAQMPPGSPAPTFTVRFEAPGTYEYLCLLHEGMSGTIVVEP